MKRLLIPLTAVLLLHAAAVSASAPSAAITGLYDDYETSGLLFTYDTGLKEGSVADLYAEYGEYYEMPVITVPLSFSMDMGSVSLGGEGTSGIVTFTVTALGERAFYKATAQKVLFAAGSKVRLIAPYALHTMKNMGGTLVLPEGVERIEHDGIGGADMPLKKVVFPASTDTLGLSAVVLTGADTLVFLGTVPPRCATGTGSAVNPWTSAAGATPQGTVVIVPEGCAAAYREKAGIGDWFTGIREKSGTATGTVQTAAEGSVRREGVWSVTGQYMGETPAALPSGIYIINGRKTAL